MADGKVTINIAICLRSAGANIITVNRLFKYEDVQDVPNEYAKSHVAYSDILIDRFSDPKAKSPEVSCVVENEILSFKKFFKILVDLYVINNQNLLEKQEH